jgi:hypothetical protein
MICGLWLEALLDTIDHGPGRVDLLGAVRRGSFHINYDAGFDIDQIVGRVGIEGRAKPSPRVTPEGSRPASINLWCM